MHRIRIFLEHLTNIFSEAKTCPPAPVSSTSSNLSPKSCSGDANAISSGRSSPLIVKPPVVDTKLDTMDEHFIETLYCYLESQNDTKFNDYVAQCIEPSYLAVLANHNSVAVRASLIKVRKVYIQSRERNNVLDSNR